MFPRKPIDMDKKRHVVLAVKTSGGIHEPFNPEHHQVTQVACVEMRNGKLTGHSIDLHVGRAGFQGVQQQLLDFIATDQATKKPAPETKLLVHFKRFVLNALRSALNEEGKKAFAKYDSHGKEWMENMISKAIAAAKMGLYHEGQIPKEIDTKHETFTDARTRNSFKQVCEGFKVSTRLWEKSGGNSAIQEANMLARAEHNRLQMVGKYKEDQAEVEHSFRPGM